MRKLLAFLLGLLLVSCGGGGGGNHSSRDSSVDIPMYSGTYIYISDLSIDKSTVRIGEQFRISWSVTTDSKGHYATFHLFSPEFGTDFASMAAPCDYSHCSLTCTVQISYDRSYMWIDCGRWESSSFFAFNIGFRLEVCVSDPDTPWEGYCDTGSVYLTIIQ